MAGFGGAIARGLRRRDEIEDRARRQLYEDVATKMARLNAEKAELENAWAVEDRPDAVARRGLALDAAREGLTQTRDETTFNRNRDARGATATALATDEAARAAREAEERRAAARRAEVDNAFDAARRDAAAAPAAAGDAIAAARRRAEAAGGTLTAEQEAVIRAAAERAADEEIERRATAAYGAARQQPELVGSLIAGLEQDARRLGRTLAARPDIVERLRAEAAAREPGAIAARDVDEAAARANAVAVLRERAINQARERFRGGDAQERARIREVVRQRYGIDFEEPEPGVVAAEPLPQPRGAAARAVDPVSALFGAAAPSRVAAADRNTVMIDGEPYQIRGSGRNMIYVGPGGEVVRPRVPGGGAGRGSGSGGAAAEGGATTGRLTDTQRRAAVGERANLMTEARQLQNDANHLINAYGSVNSGSLSPEQRKEVDQFIRTARGLQRRWSEHNAKFTGEIALPDFPFTGGFFR